MDRPSEKEGQNVAVVSGAADQPSLADTHKPPARVRLSHRYYVGSVSRRSEEERQVVLRG